MSLIELIWGVRRASLYPLALHLILQYWLLFEINRCRLALGNPLLYAPSLLYDNRAVQRSLAQVHDYRSSAIHAFKTAIDSVTSFGAGSNGKSLKGWSGCHVMFIIPVNFDM